MIKKKKKSISVRGLKKKLDAVFSEYIRKRDKGKCITCGNAKEWKFQQCGHYVSRAHNSLRYSELNCNCQCVACNCYKAGNMDEYALALQKLYGNDILKKLNKIKQTTKRFTTTELQELIIFYRNKIKNL